MDGNDGTEIVIWSRLARLTLCAATALTMAGCVNPAFRESVGQFGAATKAAAAAQEPQLAAISAQERERIRSGLARPGIVLEMHGPCSPTHIAPSEPGSPRCSIVRHDRVPIEAAPTFQNIVALETALSNYGDSLIALAADSTDDQAALAASVTSLATSASDLNNAIRTATGAPEDDLSAPLGAIASLVGELGNLYLQHERYRVLREVIVRGAPIVQRAIDVLAATAGPIAIKQRSDLYAALTAAEHEARARALDPNASPAEIRQAQDRLFDSMDAFNRSGSNARLFAEMRTAHDSLVRAAQRGASGADVRMAIDAVAHLAITAHDTITALHHANGSTDNADQHH